MQVVSRCKGAAEAVYSRCRGSEVQVLMCRAAEVQSAEVLMCKGAAAQRYRGANVQRYRGAVLQAEVQRQRC